MPSPRRTSHRRQRRRCLGLGRRRRNGRQCERRPIPAPAAQPWPARAAARVAQRGRPAARAGQLAAEQQRHWRRRGDWWNDHGHRRSDRHLHACAQEHGRPLLSQRRLHGSETYSGYDFPLVDTTGKSSICMLPNTLCAAGTVGAQDPPTFKVWGAGFGFSLSPLTTATIIVPVQLTRLGCDCHIEQPPQRGSERSRTGDRGHVQYCAVMTKTSQTIPWTSFNSTCWAPTPAGRSRARPIASNFQIQASAGTTAGAFDFCLTGLSFQ
jgi:hypothetical protein